MRPRVALVLLGAGALYLVFAVWPFQTETRLVGLGGVVVFAFLYARERRRGRRK